MHRECVLGHMFGHILGHVLGHMPESLMHLALRSRVVRLVKRAM